MQSKSTHRGHCQACGRIQAVQNKTIGVGPSAFEQEGHGDLAKHGYVVAGWGFFNGTCHGSDRKPLEVERTYTDVIIKACREAAERMTGAAADLRSGKTVPKTARTGKTTRGPMDARGRRETVYETVEWADATDYQRSQEVERLARHCDWEARQNTSHADSLIALAKDVHGRPLIPVKDSKPIEVKEGMTFKYAGGTSTVTMLLRGRGMGGRSTYVRCTCQDGKVITLSLQAVRKYLAAG